MKMKMKIKMKMISVMVTIMIMRPTKKFMKTMIMEVIRIMILSDTICFISFSDSYNSDLWSPDSGVGA